METAPIYRSYHLDKQQRLLGSLLPEGALVEVVKFLPRRRVLIRFEGILVHTMLWCLRKKEFHIGETHVC